MKRVEDQEVSTAEVEDWLHRASIGKLNIFHDRNKIIILLCREVLKQRRKGGET
tara:strand:- start:169 stop:330 length:162 start_codon:yes stop_codon:yes gene_type:complete